MMGLVVLEAAAVSWHFTLMGVLYVLAGFAHWLYPGVYLGIMPPWIPWKKSLVWIILVLN